MKYLLDTSAWLRAVNQAESIPPAVLKLLTESGETYGLSAISLWEVGKKWQLGKLSLPKPFSDWLVEAMAANIELLPISATIVADAMMLPAFPNRDPADELIVATARAHRLTLITTDTLLKGYRHARIRYFKPIRVVRPRSYAM